MQEVLAGLVERVTYHNAENGFCVLRAKARGHRDVVTVVGHAAAIAAGEWITASGEWVNDRTHGQQFKARFLRTSPPTSADGIEKYLSSGMIRGVGPVYAKKLLRTFGEKVFDVIESTPDRLREVNGIGPVRAAGIVAAWAEQKAVRLGGGALALGAMSVAAAVIGDDGVRTVLAARHMAAKRRRAAAVPSSKNLFGKGLSKELEK
jgi:exodeoxyribonuclease V alpha subunit